MENPKEKKQEDLPENVEMDKALDNILESHDPDQHTSPLKEVLIDDSDLPQRIDYMEIEHGDSYSNVILQHVSNDHYVFNFEGRLVAFRKYSSITKALEKISFGEDSINIECIGEGKFKITKN